MGRQRLDQLVALMGVGTLLFGIGPCIAPRWFGRMFAIPVESDARLLVMVRSVGVRDVALGVGLLVAALRHQDYAPWLLARIASDAGDSLAVGVAVAAGARQPRFLTLGVVALGATLTGVVLYRASS